MDCEICKKNPASYAVRFKLTHESMPREFKICESCYALSKNDKESLLKMIEKNLKT